MMSQDFSDMTVKELKVHLKDNGLPVGGRKANLIERLEQFVSGDTTTESVVEKKSKSKRSRKDPLETVKSAIRDADLTLEQSIRVLFDLYSGLPESVLEMINGEEKPEPVEVPNTKEGLKILKVAELKKILRDMGQKVGGKKSELIDRILHPEIVEETVDETVEEIIEETVEEIVEETVDEVSESEPGEPDVTDSVDVPRTEESLTALKVAELKDILRDMDQKVGGKKSILINRILHPETAREKSPSETTNDTDLPSVPGKIGGVTLVPEMPMLPSGENSELPPIGTPDDLLTLSGSPVIPTTEVSDIIVPDLPNEILATQPVDIPIVGSPTM
uniref:SAP domain protein n=1 Tax=Pithovirus LCPAC302 TaxID=2506593 RepID=A0A481Z8I2_9VIRU|nr:MAG: SAP domain protein [Pithovirus LCPAC302]